MSKILERPGTGGVPISSADHDLCNGPPRWRAEELAVAPPEPGRATTPPALAFVRRGAWLITYRPGESSAESPGGSLDQLHDRLIPILVLADTPEERDRILHVLTDRMSAVRGPRPEAGGQTMVLGELLIDRRAHRVTVDGHEVALTFLEFRLLVTLAERIDQVQSRDTLLADVWGLRSAGATRTVDTHIKRLRDKMRSAGRYIQSVRGVGYRLSEKAAVEGQRTRGASKAVTSASPGAGPPTPVHRADVLSGPNASTAPGEPWRRGRLMAST
jgi:DNA-binding winged helix-turn-helix (wHTH) protein